MIGRPLAGQSIYPSVCPIDRQLQRRPVVLLPSALRAEDIDQQLRAPCCRSRRSAAESLIAVYIAAIVCSAAGSVTLRTDEGGSTQTCCFTHFHVLSITPSLHRARDMTYRYYVASRQFTQDYIINAVVTFRCSTVNMQGGPKKRGHRLMTTILSNLNRFEFFTGRFFSKFAVKWILKIPQHLAYVATLIPV